MKSKKALAIVLAIAMLFGVVSVASAATSLATPGFADSQDSKQADAIAFLKAYGVLRGDAGTNNVRPNDALSREEFVVMVTRATGAEEWAAGLSGIRPNFTDAAQISDWAVGAVNLATGQGWIKGYEDGTFRPKGNLTMAEAITVLVRATGHERTISTTAIWPYGHIMKANQIKLSAGVAINANAPITREDMARLTYNALFIDTLTEDIQGNTQVGDPLVSAMSFVYEGEVDDVRVNDNEIDIEGETYDLADEVVLLGGNTLAALKGLEVRATANIDDVIYIIEVRGKGATGDSNYKAAVKRSGVNVGMELADGTKFNLPDDVADVTVTINGKLADLSAAANDKDAFEWQNVHAFIADMSTSDEVVASIVDGVATDIKITRYNANNYIVVDTNKVDDDTYELEVYPYDDDTAGVTLEIDASALVLVNGSATTVTGLKANDVVSLAMNQGNAPANGQVALKVKATRNTVEGTLAADPILKLGSNGQYTAWATVKKADGTTAEVAWIDNVTSAGEAQAALGVKNDPVAYLLNAAGRAVRNVADAEQSFDGKVVAIWNDGKDWVDVDIQGTVVTYADDVGLDETSLGKIGTFTYNLVDGVTGFTPASTFGGDATIGVVESVISGNIVIYKIGDEVHAVSSPLVYQANDDFDAAEDYVGIEALSPGDEIKVADNKWVIVK